jgi:hypothetical protein
MYSLVHDRHQRPATTACYAGETTTRHRPVAESRPAASYKGCSSRLSGRDRRPVSSDKLNLVRSIRQSLLHSHGVRWHRSAVDDRLVRPVIPQQQREPPFRRGKPVGLLAFARRLHAQIERERAIRDRMARRERQWRDVSVSGMAGGDHTALVMNHA